MAERAGWSQKGSTEQIKARLQLLLRPSAVADDLFTRDDEAKAVQALAAARLERARAQTAVCGAPRAKIQECRRDLVTATAKVITAERDLAQIQKDRRVWY
jgi:putative intracellular protease/amidase